MKLKLSLTYMPRLTWSEAVYRARSGDGVEKSKRGQVTTIFDKLLKDLRDEFGTFVEAVEKDFKDEFKLVFRGNEADSSNEENFERFLESCKDNQVYKKVEKMVEKVSKELLDLNCSKEIIKHIKEDIKNHLQKLDEAVFDEIMKSIERGVEERVKNKPKLYNFLDVELPNEIKEMLEKGKKYVPFLTDDEFDAELKFNGSVLDYLKRYRKYVEGADPIDKDDFKKWIDDALDQATVWKNESRHTEFYKRV